MEDEDVIKIIVFQIGRQSFGMEINTLAGIISTGHITNISNIKCPNGEKMIEINHNIIPILDLHERFKTHPIIPIENMLIVFSSNNKMLAIPIDRVETIYNVPYQNLYSVPSVMQNGKNNIVKKIANIKKPINSFICGRAIICIT